MPYERRLKILTINSESFLRLFTNLPNDARMVGYKEDRQTDQLRLVVHSDSWPSLEEGHMPMEFPLEGIVYNLDVRKCDGLPQCEYRWFSHPEPVPPAVQLNLECPNCGAPTKVIDRKEVAQLRKV